MTADMAFFTNLRPQTADIYEACQYDSSAWLLSSHRATPQTLALAAAVRARGGAIMADNGTKPQIDAVLDRFEDRADIVWKTFRDVRRELGEPSMTNMPDSVRLPAAILAQEVADFVDGLHAETDWRTRIDEQLAMDPTHVIAPEDFCIGCLIGLGLDRSMTGWSVDRYRTRNRISLDGWEMAASDPRCRDRNVYVTLAASDYHTAQAAALEAAHRGARNVAIGFAGLNNLQTATEWTSLRSRRKLTKAAGTRYVKMAEIILGLRDGYREADLRLLRFHGLGLGSRAQYPALPAMLDWWTDISVDATSPLYDAVNGRVLYDLDNQGSNVGVHDVAARILGGENSPLDGHFTRIARTVHGHDPKAARAWWELVGRPEIEMKHLLPEEPLGQSLRWLASGPGSSTTDVTRYWIGHNHWVCDQLTAEVPSRDRAEWARAKIAALQHGQGYTISRAAEAWLEILSMHDAEVS